MQTKATKTKITNADKAKEFSMYVNNESGLYFATLTKIDAIKKGKLNHVLNYFKVICEDAADLYPEYLDKRYAKQGAAIILDELKIEVDLGNYDNYTGRV